MWVFNLFLFLCWCSAQSDSEGAGARMYDKLIAEGAPCFAYIGDGAPTTEAPPCFYLGEK